MWIQFQKTDSDYIHAVQWDDADERVISKWK